MFSRVFDRQAILDFISCDTVVFILTFLTLDNVLLFFISFFHFSVNSFVAPGCLLLNEDRVKFLLTEKLSQDPIEKYFSKQPAKGGADKNTTLGTFNRNFFGLHVPGVN